ncbi:hypothetical protein A3C21_00185 [Candidatus Kaiserbacteria bacterium RIFCSPHIGHO2_02_FULL_59_21]|uniref:Uncharacterized protein n=1 Tax=Candidatus Kaiserbacteria bacterium RIFCSPHIGHO2_02_FULL_59_21 TaxID=1798500 RepID=A0A1F6E1J7_9BACT|nr:MAG: hypothetical protein A3C21_00185 [Candidatus Kaiserbacteria bacterium RIFCSPHIGHO2_02_FULL_59_21]
MRMLWNLVSFTAVAGVAAYIVFLVLGSAVEAQVVYDANRVVVRDRLGQRVHNLSGMVMVPSECHALESRAKQIDGANFLIEFRTWEDPSRTCFSGAAPKQFHLTVFAPSVGVAFQATLDDVPIPLELIPAIE